MLNRSLKEQVKGRWREFRREPSAFFWVVFMPIVWMLVLGFTFNEEKQEVYGVGWLTTQSSSSDSFKQTLDQDPYIKLYSLDRQQLETLLKRGEISIFVASKEGEGFSFVYDANNPLAQRAKLKVNESLQVAAGRKDVLSIEDKRIDAKGLRYVDFLIPGLLGLSIMTSSLFGIGMTIVSNRKENLLKRYVATPMPASSYVLSHIIGRGFILTVEFLAVMVSAWLLFDFSVEGWLLEYVLFSIVGAASFTAISMLCASRTRSIPMISGLTNLLSLAMIMLSGVFFSKSNFPQWMQEIVNFLPLTALNDGLRKIALEGVHLQALSFELGVLSIYFFICSVLATRFFKWY